MKVKAFLVLFVLNIFFFISCDNDEEYILNVGEEISDSDNSLSRAIDLVKNYEQDLVSKSGSNSEVVIDNYEKRTYTFFVPKKGIAKSALNSTSADSINVDLYYMTFSKGGNRGYAFVSGDERVNRVYAYTESGTIGDTAYIYPLACIIREIPSILERDVQKYYVNESTSRAGTYFSYGPLITTSWHQGAPYNLYTPAFQWTNPVDQIYYGDRYAAGCTNIATAQVITYYGKFTGTMFGNRNIDFDNLKRTATIGEYDSRAQVVGNFLREIISKNNSTYYNDGSTGASLEATYTYLKNMGYSCNIAKDVNVDINALYTNIKNGNPHLTSGFRKNPRGGHTWIWDGIRGYVNGSSIEVDAIHCNWGWNNPSGSYPAVNSNGWYASYEQPDPNQEPYFDDNVQLYITE